MKKGGKRRWNIFRETEMLRSDLPQICLSGDCEAYVEGVLGILEYDAQRICLRTGRQSVTFLGTELFLRCLNPQTALVCGRIRQVELNRRSEASGGGKDRD